MNPYLQEALTNMMQSPCLQAEGWESDPALAAIENALSAVACIEMSAKATAADLANATRVKTALAALGGG